MVTKSHEQASSQPTKTRNPRKPQKRPATPQAQVPEAPKKAGRGRGKRSAAKAAAAPAPTTRKAGAQRATSVRVQVEDVNVAKGNLQKHVAEVEQMFADAVVSGVAKGVQRVMASIAANAVNPNVLVPQVEGRVKGGKGGRKRGANATAPASAQADATAAPKPLRRASSRQRGSLETDARTVFDFLKKNPKSKNEDIVAVTGLDSKAVSEAIKYLRGYNVRGEVVRDPAIFLPSGDKRRYTEYSVIDGAKFPAKDGGAKSAGHEALSSDPPPSSRRAPASARRVVEASEAPADGDELPDFVTEPSDEAAE